MATKYSVGVCKKNEWVGVALFADNIPLCAMVNCCRTIVEATNEPLQDVRLMDMDTGEILWLYTSDYWDNYEPADIDDDCGFDPYMGCYTDDC